MLFFMLWILGNIGVIINAIVVYQDEEVQVIFARIGGATLNLNCAVILFPVCRHTLTWIRKIRFLRDKLPFDSNIRFHKIIAYAIFSMGLMHVCVVFVVVGGVIIG